MFQGISLCKNLKVLHLHNAIHIHNEGLSAIGSLCNLIALRLHKATYLSSDTLLTLFQPGNMKNLAYLSVAASSHVNDDCALSIAKFCPQLHVLSLALIDRITDCGVETIVKNCTSLHYLDLYNTRNVTGPFFNFISKFSSNVNFIVIEQVCSREKEKFVNILKEENSKVNVHQAQIWKTGRMFKCSLLN